MFSTDKWDGFEDYFYKLSLIDKSWRLLLKIMCI